VDVANEKKQLQTRSDVEHVSDRIVYGCAGKTSRRIKSSIVRAPQFLSGLRHVPNALFI
jgi:hypothetical protein